MRSLSRRRAAQDGLLPLHFALRYDASVEAVAALLAAHPQAEAEVDMAKLSVTETKRLVMHGQSSALAGRATQQVKRIYTYYCRPYT